MYETEINEPRRLMYVFFRLKNGCGFVVYSRVQQFFGHMATTQIENDGIVV